MPTTSARSSRATTPAARCNCRSASRAYASAARICTARAGTSTRCTGWPRQRLAGRCVPRSRRAELAGTLSDLHASTAALLDPPHLPDQARAAQVAALIARLARLPLPPGVRPPPAAAAPAPPEGPADPAPGPPPTRCSTRPTNSAQRRLPGSADRPTSADAHRHRQRAQRPRRSHAPRAGRGRIPSVFQRIVSLRDDDKEQFQALLRLPARTVACTPPAN